MWCLCCLDAGLAGGKRQRYSSCSIQPLEYSLILLPIFSNDTRIPSDVTTSHPSLSLLPRVSLRPFKQSMHYCAARFIDRNSYQRKKFSTVLPYLTCELPSYHTSFKTDPHCDPSAQRWPRFSCATSRLKLTNHTQHD